MFRPSWGGGGHGGIKTKIFTYETYATTFVKLFVCGLGMIKGLFIHFLTAYIHTMFFVRLKNKDVTYKASIPDNTDILAARFLTP